MCGLVTYIEYGGDLASEPLIKEMADAISHRGPDAEGYYVNGAVALGHKRLSIIDLSVAANQPMISPDGRYILVYNGEIYNYLELKSALEQDGTTFDTASDTEVVLKHLVKYGAEGIKDFNGMFAFVFFDKTTKKFIAGRDRYGVKPLYIANFPNTVALGSEIKALLRHPSINPEVDREGLAEYFSFQNFFTDRTLFKNIRMVPPGSYICFSTSERPREPVSYWDYDFTEQQLSPADWHDALDECLTNAVKRQLVGDVDVSTYLSGGIDSGIVTYLASKSVPDLQTFTVGFDLNSASGMELGFDEREKAEHISYLTQTSHYQMVLKSGDMERAMKKLVYHLEEPRVGQSYPNYYAARLASKFSKVVLSGVGGDELFGGYPWRYYRAVINSDFDQYIGKYFDYWQRLIPGDDFIKIFRPIHAEIADVNPREIFRSVFPANKPNELHPRDYPNLSLYFEAKTFLHGLLTVEDKLSMAHGLETRLPFLDNDLVDLAMRMPIDLKLGNLGEVIRLNENEPGLKTKRYFEKTNDGKRILRDVAAEYLPLESAQFVKQGFSAPDASWFRGESIEYVKRRLLHKDARLYDYMERNTVTSLINDHISGKENRRLLVWSLLYFEEFLDVFTP